MDMNMDVKDIIAKIKGKGKKTDAKTRKNGGIANFFKKNPKMKIIIPSVLVVIAVAVSLIIVFSGINTETKLNEEVSVAGKAVEVLPQLERNKSEELADGADPFSEDVIANAKITGIIYNSDGYRTATIETKVASYVIQAGDYVGGSEWLVDSITDNTVTFSLGEKTRTVEMK